MFAFAAAVAAAPLVVALYAYLGYPLILWTVVKLRNEKNSRAVGRGWPFVTIVVPVHNAVSSIRTTVERLLELDYPAERLQLLVVSDASTDGTDQVVESLRTRRVELLRLPNRGGKTLAENAALNIAWGEIIVNVDATVVVPPGSLKSLVRVFDDPTVGVASGRDVSVGVSEQDATGAESRYVGYEMWIRDLETKVGSIIGASGCFYGVRRCIHSDALPADLSWDFASALVARQQGFRSISVRDAVCLVPRTPYVLTELRRKARTMARGLRTLFYFRSLMNPVRYGGFAFMLVSHKLLRWLPYLLAPFAIIALALIATHSLLGAILLSAFLAGLLATSIDVGKRDSNFSKPVAVVRFGAAAIAAGAIAWWDALRGTPMAVWEPTPRSGTSP